MDHCAQLSGAELALLRLLRPLSREVEASVLLFEDGPLVSALSQASVPVEVLSSGGSLNATKIGTGPLEALRGLVGGDSIRFLLALARHVRQRQPDLIHTNSLKSAVYGGLVGRLVGVPVVWHVRDRVAGDYLRGSTAGFVRALSLVLPSIMIANSWATRESLPARGRRVEVVHDCVEPPAEVAAVRPEVASIVVLGRLAPWKGQDVFLRAFAQVFRGRPVRARLLGSAMFGEDEFVRCLEDLVRELGIEDQVEFAGFREDVFRELREEDILVHCSTIAEPFGQVVIEGMAAGLPVIASDLGGPREVVQHDHDGLLCPPGDVQALATALERLAGDKGLRERLAARARETAARYSPSATASAVRQVYDRIA